MRSDDEGQSVQVAIVQASPLPSDVGGGLVKALALIEEAAKHGAQVICFGETFLPGYPAWLDVYPGAALWNHAPVKETFAELRANSVLVPGKETGALAEAAARLRVGIVMGVSERVRDAPGHGTLFNSLLFFACDGRLVNHHRKLIPTYSERMVWGQGDAAGLRIAKMHNVNVGGAICWWSARLFLYQLR
jgi:predicted amidohydrolase